MSKGKQALGITVFCLGLTLLAGAAQATISLPGNAGDRTQVLNDMRAVCPDVPLMAQQQPDGSWILVKDGEPGPGHSSGCELLCRLVDADCNVDVDPDPGNPSGGTTTPTDPDNAQNGVGSDSKVKYDPMPTIRYTGTDGMDHPATGPAILAHELCHSEDMWLGLDADETAEENAIKLWENPHHRDNGEPERKGHGGKAPR